MTLPKHEKARRQLKPRVAHFNSVSTGRTALYRIYDADGILLKMNISASAQKRFIQYKRMTRWCPRDAYMTNQNFATRAEAERALHLALETEHPLREVYGYREKK